MEMCTPNSERFQGNMRLLEIYDPKPAQNSTERGAGYGMTVRSGFPIPRFIYSQHFRYEPAGPPVPASPRAPPLPPQDHLPSLRILLVLLFHLFLNICHQGVGATSSEGTAPSSVAQGLGSDTIAACHFHLRME